MILLLFGLTILCKWLVITASILLWVFSLRASGVGSWPPGSIEHRRPSPARGSEWEYPNRLLAGLDHQLAVKGGASLVHRCREPLSPWSGARRLPLLAESMPVVRLCCRDGQHSICG